MQNHTKTNLPLQLVADAANTLTRFLGVRDLPKLSHKTLQRRYGNPGKIDNNHAGAFYATPHGCRLCQGAET